MDGHATVRPRTFTSVCVVKSMQTKAVGPSDSHWLTASLTGSVHVARARMWLVLTHSSRSHVARDRTWLAITHSTRERGTQFARGPPQPVTAAT